MQTSDIVTDADNAAIRPATTEEQNGLDTALSILRQHTREDNDDTTAIEILSLYKSLSEREQQNAYNAMLDASHRTDDAKNGDQASTERNEVIIHFTGWLADMTQKPVDDWSSTAKTLWRHDLTTEQHTRLIQAWATIYGVFQETDARTKLLYREPDTTQK